MKKNYMTKLAKIETVNELIEWAYEFQEDGGVLTDAEATLLDVVLTRFDEEDVPVDILEIVEHAIEDPEAVRAMNESLEHAERYNTWQQEVGQWRK